MTKDAEQPEITEPTEVIRIPRSCKDRMYHLKGAHTSYGEFLENLLDFWDKKHKTMQSEFLSKQPDLITRGSSKQRHKKR